MSTKDRVQYSILVLLWVLSVLNFFNWWFSSDRIVHSIGSWINTLVIAWTTLLPAYYFFFLWRMRRPNQDLTIPKGRVAMVVTKVPSESFEMITATLMGMLNQSYPHDTWLADEDPSVEIIEWCIDNGVMISCRKGISEYNNSSWPRRAKTKEGNLAYFYDRHAYDSYDFVVQLDADHCPDSGYLENMLRAFNDPTVGYVAAPSICDKNENESWVVRARVDAEATLHGALQAGYNEGWAPMCIGSHYAVRTKALKAAGGLGPELAEDHSTTLLMNAAGWKGAFAFDAIARGYGAPGFYDAMIQEYQWARSLMNIFYQWTPRYLGCLSLRLKFQFLFSQLWYPLTGLAMLVSSCIPILAVINDEPLMNMDYMEFMVYFLPTVCCCLAIVLWVQIHGWTRPTRACAITWKVILFQFTRWPWILLGCLDSTISTIRGKQTCFRVTPKGEGSQMPMSAILPYLIISATSGVVACLGSHNQSITGYYYMLYINCALYLLVAISVTALHYCEKTEEIVDKDAHLCKLVRNGF